MGGNEPGADQMDAIVVFDQVHTPPLSVSHHLTANPKTETCTIVSLIWVQNETYCTQYCSTRRFAPHRCWCMYHAYAKE